MKNIPLQSLIDQITYTSQKSIQWPQLVVLSRLEAGLSSVNQKLTRFSLDTGITREKILAELKQRGYLTVENRLGIFGLKAKEHQNHIENMVDFTIFSGGDHTADMTAVGDQLECESIAQWFKDTFNTLGSVIHTATELDSHGRVETDKTFIPEGEFKMAKQSFYPWLSVPLEEYYQSFMDAEESILVMFGDAGTGKSTFLRSLIAHGNYQAFLAYNKEVVESPALLRTFFQHPKARILGYEDIDRHLGKREDDNFLMSSLLNAADGVVQRKGKKIVFVTNLPSVNRIDQALLRAGRCFDILEFRHLSNEEAGVVRSDMGKPPLDYTGRHSWSLAEVLSDEYGARQAINRFGTKLGFVE